MNSNIQFVDLAGSERIAKSLTEGHKFEETILINTSLTSLGKVKYCGSVQWITNILIVLIKHCKIK